MSSRYQVGDNALPHFITSSVVGWIDVFSREQYKVIFVESLNIARSIKG
jgi:hypothetical protein